MWKRWNTSVSQKFCDACRDFHYIGLCHGPPGVGKTLSARRYAKADLVAGLPPPQKLPLQELERWRGQHTVFHTAPVVTSPGGLGRAIAALRSQLHALLLEPLRREEEAVREAALELDRERQRQWKESLPEDWTLNSPPKPPSALPSWEQLECWQARRRGMGDPTRLVIMDEADRLRMASLEAARAIFDQGGVGLVLIGMPGMEKRLARYPRFYSRIGFVHAFRPLSPDAAPSLQRMESGGTAAPAPFTGEAVAIRFTGDNFPLPERLLTQPALPGSMT